MKIKYCDNSIQKITDEENEKIYTFTNEADFLSTANQAEGKNNNGSDYWILTCVEYLNYKGETEKIIRGQIDKEGNYSCIVERSNKNSSWRVIFIENGHVIGDCFAERDFDGKWIYYATPEIFVNVEITTYLERITTPQTIDEKVNKNWVLLEYKANQEIKDFLSANEELKKYLKRGKKRQKNTENN